MSQLPVVDVPSDSEIPLLYGLRECIEHRLSGRLFDGPSLRPITGNVAQHTSSVVAHLQGKENN